MASAARVCWEIISSLWRTTGLPVQRAQQVASHSDHVLTGEFSLPRDSVPDTSVQK